MNVSWEILGVGAANLAAISAAWASNKKAAADAERARVEFKEQVMDEFTAIKAKIGNGGSVGNFVPRESCALVERAVAERFVRLEGDHAILSARVTQLESER